MQKLKLYTTSKSPRLQELAERWALGMMASKGRDIVIVEVIYKIPRTVKTYKDKSGDTRLDWTWFRSQFQGEDGDWVAFHFTPTYRRKWGIKKAEAGKVLNGSRNSDNKEFAEFWFCTDVNKLAEGYQGLSEVERLLYHESGHFEEDRDDLYGDPIKQGTVHLMDYELKAIDRYPALIDLTTLNKLDEAHDALGLWAWGLKQLKGLTTSKKSVYQAGLDFIGVDASPADLVDDVVGCAESVSMVLKQVVDMPVITGTWTMFDYFENDPRFKRVTVPIPGNIVLSPTGSGNGSIRGHVGIVGKNGVIMSNDSYSGKWMANFTIDSWAARYKVKGGMPVYFYKVI